IDHEIVDLRAELAPRGASDRLTFVAIDKESLDHVGQWPWPRSVHAEIIDTLMSAGAADVFLDVDFSTPSTPEGDQALAAALERAGGGVLLPVFEQHQHIQDAASVAVTHPIELLAQHSWPAAANVIVDDAGRFRGFGVGLSVGDVILDSAPVLLAGVQRPDLPVLPIDFSIHPGSVSVISAADLLRGEANPDLLRGRSVVVGAYATELKDLFPVPVYGILSGPMLHVLAAETLLQDRVPQVIPVWPLGLLLALALLFGSKLLRTQRVGTVAAIAVTMSGLLEIVGYFLQREWSLQLISVTYHLMIVTGLAAVLLEKIGLAAWLLEIASAERRNSRRILKRVISDSTDAVLIIDSGGRIIDLSRSAANFFDVPYGLRRGDDFRTGVPAQIVALVERLSLAVTVTDKLLPSMKEEITVMQNGKPLDLEVAVTLSRLEDNMHEDAGFSSFVSCLTIRDVSARKAYETKLRRLSQIDDLTGALNRRELVNRLAQCGDQGIAMAVTAIDLHRFASINATFGRATGDHLLSAVARRLMAGAHEISSDSTRAFVARLGGDVFCVAVAVGEGEDLAIIPERVLALFVKTFDARGIKVHMDVRIGACLLADALGAAASLEAAELALDEAKKIGGSGWHIYDPLAAVQQAKRMRLEQEMRHALRDNQFFLTYQPQVAMASGAVSGAEALMRWKHPDLGLVSPLDFIEVAESNGFICELGRWALVEACSAASSWPSHLTVAVNVSAVQFAKADLCADVGYALALSGLEPGRLHLEVTETAFLLDPERLLRQVMELRALGIRIALDDFGTGYSSLGYIARFPFDKIKIDQCFIRGIVDSPANQAIVQSVQSLASGLGMATVCEGVEEEAEWRMLAGFGCQQGQGYYFGKPQTAEELLQGIIQTKPEHRSIA
ncbi:MAG TPA: EAL domain-containing protein, partial [Pseudorhizobium sp.]|nr:EAL domain-containing protein [Pseudorhizobium sp.]